METIERHKTAIRRSALSRPVQSLLDSGVLNHERSFFDYGCGYGDDVAILTENGFTAAGYDPVYFPNQELVPSDIVNLGYVLNVIENALERKRVLKKATGLARRALSIAVLDESSYNRPSGEQYADGIVTRRKTFQRLYSNQELIHLVGEVTGLFVATVGPGVVFAFKHSSDRAEYLLRRIRRTSRRMIRERGNGISPDQRIAALKGDAPEQWEEYLDFVNDRGRQPESHESLLLNLAASRALSARAVFDAAVEQIGSNEFERSRAWNRNNLLVFLAGTIVDGGTRMSELSPALKADVKYHYGSFARAQNAAMELLKDAASRIVRRQVAASQSVGEVSKDGYYIQAGDIPHLDAPLRAYIQLGSLFFGDYNDAELLKIHLTSNKLTFYVQSPTNEQKAYDAFKVDFDRRRMDSFWMPYERVRPGKASKAG